MDPSRLTNNAALSRTSTRRQKKLGVANRKQRNNYAITHFVSNFDELNRPTINKMLHNVGRETNRTSGSVLRKSILTKLSYWVNLTNPKRWIFLTLFSIVITVLIIVLDTIILAGQKFRRQFLGFDDEIFGFVFWVLSALFFILIGSSVGYFISADADGSGIPEIKTVLSGINIHKYFSFNALVGKLIGIVAVVISGASIGRAGPYVHISTLVCHRMMKIPYFHSIGKSLTDRNNMISAASAVGITLALGSPLGAVIFSIECTSSIYIISNLWQAYYCSVVCFFTSKILNSHSLLTIIIVNDTEAFKYNSEIIFVVILAILSGIIGAMMSHILANLVAFRKRTSVFIFKNRFAYAILIGLFTSISQWFVRPLTLGDQAIMGRIFTAHPDVHDNVMKPLLHPNDLGYTILCWILKSAITITGLAVNMPAGVFGPVMTSGAFFGKAYGHLLEMLFKVKHMEHIYSMVAATCVLSGASHSLASALIVFEESGEMTYLIPLLFCSVIANAIGQALAMNVFDVLLSIKNLPYLPTLKPSEIYEMDAGELASPIEYYFDLDNFTYLHALDILIHVPKKYYIDIPVIEEGKHLRYTIKLKPLFKYVLNRFNELKKEFNHSLESKYEEIFKILSKKIKTNTTTFYQHLKNKIRKMFNRNIDHVDMKDIFTLFEEVKKDKNQRNIDFLNDICELNDSSLQAQPSGLCIDVDFSGLRVQFLLTFLNISQVWVTDDGVLVGVISKIQFIEKCMELSNKT